MNEMNLRRRTLLNSGLGFGSLALNCMLNAEGFAAAPESDSLLAANGLPRFAPKAKSVIWLFMRGGVSHMESFDPKPALNQYSGMSIADTPFADVQNPERLKKVRVVVVNDANGQQRNRIYPLQVGYRKYGQSGIEISDWFPKIGSVVDDISIIRSMWTTDDNHGAQVQFHSGRHMLDPRVPTIGAWVNWGLGTLNENLPQFISMGPRFFDRRDGHYLGPAYDSVELKVDPKNPLDFAAPERSILAAEQRLSFDLVNRLNKLTARSYPDDSALDARIKSYELAFRMQTAVPNVIDFSGETEATKKLYGFDQKETRPFAEQLLAARRFAEQGVRFIQIQHGSGAAGEWDQHSGLKAKHAELAMQVDRPVAGLISDLKQRGMLDETLVVVMGEFGRTPKINTSGGRDHWPRVFSVALAGGGIRGGQVVGSSDAVGESPLDRPVTPADLVGTIYTALGIDPSTLITTGTGRPIRLVSDESKIVSELLT